MGAEKCKKKKKITDEMFGIFECLLTQTIWKTVSSTVV